MSIREEIQTRRSQRENGGMLSRAVRKAFIRIMCGYVVGTVIGLLLRRLLNG